MAAAPGLTTLGVVGDLEVLTALSDTPWTLPIDGLVLPVDARAWGELGRAYLAAFPDVPLPVQALSVVTPEKPFLASVAPVETGRFGNPTFLILATVRPPGRGVVNLSALGTAVRAVLEMARSAGVTRLGLPLLSTGSGGSAVDAVAAATIAELARSAGHGMPQVVLFDRRPETLETLQRVWDATVTAAAPAPPPTGSASPTPSPSAPDEAEFVLSGTAQRVLDQATAAAGGDANRVTAALVWYQALANATSGDRRDVAATLFDAVSDAMSPVGTGVLSRLGPLATIPIRAARPGRRALLTAAEGIAARTNSSGYIRQRHLLAAVVLDPDAAQQIEKVVGWPPGGARAALRSAISAVLPYEFPQVWHEVLQTTLVEVSVPTPSASSETRPRPQFEVPPHARPRAQFEVRPRAPDATSSKTPSATFSQTPPAGDAVGPPPDPLIGPEGSNALSDDANAVSDDADAALEDGELAGGISADLVNPDQGIPLDQDHLGVSTYVTMLATVIADRDTPLPLSVGLFGEWGSGKSYFMGLLRQQIDDLSAADGDAYLSGIEHIGFNAWHYADTNLWASLGNTIFEKLAGTGESNDARRAQLRQELVERLDRRQELDEATTRAQQETQALRTDLAQARADRASAGANLLAAMSQAPEVGSLLNSAWAGLGVRDEADKVRLVVDETRGLRADGEVLRRATSGLRAAAVVGVVVLSLALIGIGLVSPPSARHWLAGVGVAGVASGLGAAALVIAQVRKGITALSRAVTQTRDRALARADAGLQTPYDELNQAITREQVLVAQRDEAVARVGEISRELADLDPGRQWYGFLADRAGSSDYRGQLGLVSTIRRDFTKLIALMKDWRDHPDEHGDHAPINRIVLYIDDLDRCSPSQVMDVLQAVHLLLALDLFVVVVGVDPRWLLQSLRQQYQSNFADGAAGSRPGAGSPGAGSAGGAVGGGEWAAEPLDYLEKIFNIPFVLPRMTTDSFATLIRHISADTQRASEERRQQVREPVPLPRPGRRIGGIPAFSDPGDGSGVDWDAQSDPVSATPLIPVEAGSAVALAQAGKSAPPRRGLTEDELAMLGRLGTLVESPREAKRLLNLYRTLRSTRDLSRASDFLERDGGGGEYQAVIVLLGILSARPQLLGDLLDAPAVNHRPGGICGRSADTTWTQVVDGLRPRPLPLGDWENDLGPLSADDAQEWTYLLDRLAAASTAVTLPDLAPFQAWGPRIARFSFVLSPLAAAVS